MTPDEEAGMGIAGWFLARALLLELVRTGAIPQPRAVALIDQMILAFELTEAGTGSPANAAVRARLEILLQVLSPGPPDAPR